MPLKMEEGWRSRGHEFTAQSIILTRSEHASHAKLGLTLSQTAALPNPPGEKIPPHPLSGSFCPPAG